MLGRALVLIYFFLTSSVFALSPQDASNLRTEALSKIEALKSTLPEKQNLKYRFDEKTYALRSILGFKTQSQPSRDSKDVALDFLNQNKSLFQIGDGMVFLLDREHRSPQEKNMLFKIKHRGIPVEFSKVSVHATANNEVFSAFSSLDGNIIGIDPAPTVQESQAKATVESSWAKTHLNGVVGELVYLPDTLDGDAHLAWKFRFRLNRPLGLWSVYVDAHSGKIVGEVNELRSINVTVRAAHWRKDPSDTSLTGVTLSTMASPVRGVLAWSGDGATMTQLNPSNASGVVNNHPGAGNGFYATLRSTYAVVVDDEGNNQVIAVGGLANPWRSVAISSSSASPYSVNTRTAQTYTCPANTVLSSLRFGFFDVGFVSKTNTEESSTQDDFDYVEVLQPSVAPSTAARLAVYTGDSRSPFNTFPSTGTQSILNLVANGVNGNGSEGGYQVIVTSCLVQSAGGGPLADVVYDYPSSSASVTGGQLTLTNIFKHIGEVQVRLSSAEVVGSHSFTGGSRWNTALKDPVIVHANFSTDLANAFFDPDLNGLFFGKGNSSVNQSRNLGLATDIVMHEYTHWAVDKIYELSNFGQSGAISEALADYIALDAFNGEYAAFVSSKSTFGEWAFPPTSGSAGDCGKSTELCRQLKQSSPKQYPGNWTGEIHDDSMILSGALWDLKESLGSQGDLVARGLIKDALFYFPDSFQGFFEAMMSASRGDYDGQITTAFNAHGIGTWGFAGSDNLEPNDAFQTAKTIASGAKTQATIYPAGDVDMFRFVAGAGNVTVTLNRPFDSNTLMYLGYGFQVFDIGRQVLATAMPSGVFELRGNSYVSDKTASATISLTAPKLLYVAISAPFGSGGNNDRSNSASLKYDVTTNFSTPLNALSATQISAQMTDQRTIHLTANNLTGFGVEQSTEAVVDHVDVRDHALTRLANVSNLAAGSEVTVNSQSAGRVDTTVVLPANFFTLYPAIGSIYLELFVKNPSGRIYSIGLSNEIKIFTDQTGLTAYNNVFNPAKNQKATLRYQAATSGRYRMVIYTLAGDVVKTLVDRDEIAGMSSVDWDGKNGSGDIVASGIYLVHFEGPSVRTTKKVAVVK